MRAQVTLTVNEAKKIIAKGIANLPVIQKALKSGKIFVKGGTTVSAVCEELTGKALHISGRIIPEGTRSARFYAGKFHCGVIEKGQLLDADQWLEKAIEALKGEDVGIIGANAFDMFGNAALMYGRALGGNAGKIISGLMAEIRNIIVAVGLEKFVPGSIIEMIANTGRKEVDLSMGMAVGLTPIVGRIITEKEAIPLLADVSCMVIGRGGIFGAEGGTTMIIDGKSEEVKKVFRIISSIKGAEVSGLKESLSECVAPQEKCKMHRACMYKRTRNK